MQLTSFTKANENTSLCNRGQKLVADPRGIVLINRCKQTCMSINVLIYYVNSCCYNNLFLTNNLIFKNNEKIESIFNLQNILTI